MGRKKINSKKIKKQELQKKILKMSCKELTKKGNDYLVSLKGKDALKMFKIALDKSNEISEQEKIKSYMINAYWIRIQQLRNKKMVDEAQIIQKQVLKNIPDMAFMDENSMVSLFYMCNLEKAIKFFTLYCSKNKKTHRLERYFADKLISENCWDKVELINKAAQLIRDVPVMKDVVSFMNQGEWKDALEKMRPLPRSSPFAHIRMFCRAMTAFYADNDKDLKKAVSMIPQGSIFKKMAEPLLNLPSPENKTEVNDEKERLLQCVWQGPFNIFNTLNKLLNLMAQKKYNKKIEEVILLFSEQLFPENKELACKFILETMYSSTADTKQQFFDMMFNLIKDEADDILLKINILFTGDNLYSVVSYLDHMHREFSDTKDLSVAKAMIIHFISERIFYGYSPLNLSRCTEENMACLGISAHMSQTILLQMVAHGASLDPENRDLFELAIRLPCKSGEAKEVKEQLLLTMRNNFPLDPAPCLALSDFYQEKNAYRKAENILKKAMELAPYDSDVLDLRVISLLISADKSLNRKNFNMVWKDFENAESINSKTNEVLVKEKKLVYKICQNPKLYNNISDIFPDTPSLFLRLQILSMIVQDFNRRNLVIDNKNLKQIEKIFAYEVKSIKKLSSTEILKLLSPMPSKWKYLFNNLCMLKLFLDKSKKILRLLDESDLLTLIDQTLCSSYYLPFMDELEERRLMKKNIGNKLIEFYHTAVESLYDDDWNYGAFIDIVDDDNDAVIKKELEEAAIKFSKHTTGHVKHALETFDFRLLGNDLFSSHFYDDYDDDYDYDDDDDDDDDYGYYDDDYGDDDDDDDLFTTFFNSDLFDTMPDEILNTFIHEMLNEAKLTDDDEMLKNISDIMDTVVDKYGVKGASVKKLKLAKKIIMEEKVFRILSSFAKHIHLSGFKNKLSREAKILFID